MLKELMVSGCLVVAIVHKSFAISPKKLFQPYETFVTILNATTERDLQQATNRVESLSMRFFSSMSAICSESLSLGDEIRLRWDGAQIGNVDMRKISARTIWMLNSLFDEKLPCIPPEINEIEEQKIVKKVRDIVASASFFTTNEKRQASKILGGITAMTTDENLLWLAERSDNSVVLEKLATLDNIAVRIAVATNQFVSINTLYRLKNDTDRVVAALAKQTFKQNYEYAHDCDSFNKTLPILHTIAFSAQSDLLNIVVTQQLQSMPEAEKREMYSWLASRLCDLRFSPAPGNESLPPGHDLSLIGGKCAYLLEKLLDEKLVPVRRDTPLDTLEKQRERLLKRVNDMQ